VRDTWPASVLLFGAVAAALWAAGPFEGLPALAPSGGAAAAGFGATAAALLVLGVGLAGALLVWLAGRRARAAAQWLVLAATAFGLFLLLVPLVLAAGGDALAWSAAGLVAGCAALLLRRPGWPSWSAGALAAGGFAGLLGAVAGLAVLCVVVAAVCAYDAWSVRRHRMAAVSDAVRGLGAGLEVGPPAAFSLGLGDLLLPAAVVAAASDPRHAAAGPAGVGSTFGLAAGFILLAWSVRRGGDSPGTPFLCGGALAGAAAGLLFG